MSLEHNLSQPLSVDVDQLLNDAASGVVYTRRSAAKKLGELVVSSEAVIEALIRIKEVDKDASTRSVASESLLAPAHQAFIQQHPEVIEKINRNVQQQSEKLQKIPQWSMSWSETWMLALTKPSLGTYERISRDPDATASRARKWLFSGFFFYGILTTLVAVWIVLGDMGRRDALFQVLFSGTGLSFLIGSVIVGAVGMAAVMAATYVSHLFAKGLNGEGTYVRFLYTCAAYFSPLVIMLVIPIALPIRAVQFLIIPIGLFSLLVNVLALNAVYRVGWVKAVICSLAGQAALVGLFILIASLFQSLSPQIN